MSFDEIIDLKNYKKVNDSNLVIVDKNIADAILSLNKFGYVTVASCGGHFSGRYYYEQIDCDNEFLEDVKKDKHCTITNYKEKTFDYVSDQSSTTIYIMFDKKYNFSNLPEGFKLETEDTLRHTIHFIDDAGKRKSFEEIENEIKKYNEILKEWANNLPEMKGNDKNE